MLAILTSHPIQYQAPLWRTLADDGRVPFEVWFLTEHAVRPSIDREFGKRFAWDSNLLDGYSYRFLPIHPGWRMDRFRGIRVTESWAKLFKEHKVTHLWVEGWRFWENWSAILTARRLGIEVWLRGETNDLVLRQGLRERARRFLLGRLFRCVKYFLCIGSANGRFYRSFGIEEHRLLTTPYCVDNEWFSERASRLKNKRTEVRKIWGISEGSYCILFCGKFLPKKRPMDLVRAAHKVAENEKKIHLLFVGSGILGDVLRGEVEVVFDAETSVCALKSGENSNRLTATFSGFLNQSEITRAYIAADCIVLPSDAGETWGLVINEAMAAGLPCIASDHCGCAEDLVAPLSRRGVFRMGDIEALSVAIEEMISHPPSPESIKQHVGRFDIECTVKVVVSTYLNTALE